MMRSAAALMRKRSRYVIAHFSMKLRTKDRGRGESDGRWAYRVCCGGHAGGRRKAQPGAIAGRRPRRRVAHADRRAGSWSRRRGHSGSPCERLPAALTASLSRRQRYRPRSWKVLEGQRYSSRALEVMQRNFGKTVNADGNDRCPDTDRGITQHITMFPRSRAHMPWQNRIKSDWNRSRQTDLTSMGMAAHKKIETAVCGLPIDFRRMGQED